MSLFRHQVVHNGEYTFFHLTGILSTKNDHFPLLKVEGNTCVTVNVGDVFIGVELASVENIIISAVGEVLLELFIRGLDEHVCHEERVVGSCADDSDTDAFLLVVAGISIDDVESLSGVEIVPGQVFQYSEGTASHWHVDLAPSDLFFADGVSHNSLGTWGSAEFSYEYYPVFWPE